MKHALLPIVLCLFLAGCFFVVQHKDAAEMAALEARLSSPEAAAIWRADEETFLEQQRRDARAWAESEMIRQTIADMRSERATNMQAKAWTTSTVVVGVKP
jgi:hypothetical protein